MEVLIEFYEDNNNKVVIHYYDKETNTITEYAVKIVPVSKAYEKYEVVGELVNQEIKLYDSEDSEYADSEYYV